MEKFWNWLNGRKSIITAIIIFIVNSEWFSGLFTDQTLYLLVQGVAVILFGGSVVHHEMKRAKEGK